jgi:hypothetical protein
MAWTYSGDPSSSEKDLYRFYIGDTMEDDPILQDGEVNFVVSTIEDHSARLYQLYDAAAQFFARQIERKVGPIEERPLERQRHFEAKAAYYKKLISSYGLSIPKASDTIFTKGMHDNARY